MNILIVGAGKGSFTMRGIQIGAALGARVVTAPSDADLRWASLVVLVKRAGLLYATPVHRAGLPFVWDALDFWRQPAENHFTEGQAKALLLGYIAKIRPALTIGATEAMAAACGGVCVRHHCWNGLIPTPARDRVQIVAYQGGEVYLGTWRQVLERACQRRGWRFVINPTDLSAADLLVAFRDGPWDGWMCREWKSGVKVGNAIAAGRPLICHDSAAVRELQPLGSVVDTPAALAAALDLWTDVDRRAAVVEHARTRGTPFALATIAASYRTMLQAQRQLCAA